MYINCLQNWERRAFNALHSLRGQRGIAWDYGLYQNKGPPEAELNTCPILVMPMAQGFTEHKNLNQFFLNKIFQR
jgi:hypothetical protein